MNIPENIPATECHSATGPVWRLESERVIFEPGPYIVTDGCCFPNGYGGWAFLLRYDRYERIGIGCAARTDAERMEIQSVWEAIRCLGRLGQLDEPRRIHIVTDFGPLVKQFSANALQQQPKPPRHADLVDEIAALLKGHIPEWTCVKSHGNHADQRRAHRLAQLAAGHFNSETLLDAGWTQDHWRQYAASFAAWQNGKKRTAPF